MFSRVDMWLFACKCVQWEGSYMCVSQTPGSDTKRTQEGGYGTFPFQLWDASLKRLSFKENWFRVYLAHQAANCRRISLLVQLPQLAHSRGLEVPRGVTAGWQQHGVGHPCQAIAVGMRGDAAAAATLALRVGECIEGCLSLRAWLFVHVCLLETQTVF